jgi:hypothetical protein
MRTTLTDGIRMHRLGIRNVCRRGAALARNEFPKPRPNFSGCIAARTREMPGRESDRRRQVKERPTHNGRVSLGSTVSAVNRARCIRNCIGLSRRRVYTAVNGGLALGRPSSFTLLRHRTAQWQVAPGTACESYQKNRRSFHMKNQSG